MPQSLASATRPNSSLELPVTALPGIGDDSAKLLDRIDIRTVGDLLWHLPRTYVDFSKANYPYVTGYEPYDPMGGRFAETDSEVLLRYEGQPALQFSAYSAVPHFYLRNEPLRGRVVVDGCTISRPFGFEGSQWKTFRVSVPCAIPPGSNVRVRILLDNVFDLPVLYDRQRGILIRDIGFVQ